MNTIYAMVLTFVNGAQINTSQEVSVYPTQAECEAQLTASVSYQAGVHSTDGWLVNGWCRPVHIVGPKS
jgi:hypothetical protein